MIRRTIPVDAFLLATLISFSACSRPPATWRPITVDELAIEVTGPSREVAYTNKQAGFWYTETNSEHRSSWQGWNVMAKEILEDYQITDGEKPLRKSDVRRAKVCPHQMKRVYRSGVLETLTLLDSVDAIVVQMEKLQGTALSVRPLFKDFNQPQDYVVKFQEGVLLIAHERHLKRTTEENYPVWIGVSFADDAERSQFVQLGDTIGTSYFPAAVALASSAKTATIIFTAGDSEEQVIALSKYVSKNYRTSIEHRRQRMESLLNRSYIRTDDGRLDKAMRWALLSMDALVMNQVKKGIFAGLPWFTDYWGRHSFIALPGATLVTGDFAEAKEILRSFAEWQEQNPRSTNYGRIPNLVTTGTTQYNTTDGTPRFVIGLRQYFQYSNDTVFVRSLYPVVKRSIDGALLHHVDQHGFLKHGDAETWMDAAGPTGPWSPRGDRANDIQALWYHQLKEGAMLATLANDRQSAQVWEKIATAVRANFNKFFPDSAGTSLTDHLNADGTQDHQLRPNQLFAFDIIGNEELKARLFKTVTEKLVYVHGVGSLSQGDENFHPYHHYPPYYVQDAAYHNGIVWTWLAGIWIDLATSYRLPDLAFTLTQNMVHQILDRGAVGTMSELLDAAPRPSEKEPRLSGTFSQAWSLAEFLRVFYQDYLGVSVDAPNKTLTLSPRLPSSMHGARFRIAVGHDRVDGSYTLSSSRVTVTLRSIVNATSSARQDSIRIFFDGVVKGVGMKTTTSLPSNAQLKIVLAEKGSELTMNGQAQKIEPTIIHEPAVPTILKNLALATPTVRSELKSLKGPPYRLLTNAAIKTESKQATVLYDVEDPQGDDTGTGAYVYPLTRLLRPGSLDITHFTVAADDKNVKF